MRHVKATEKMRCWEDVEDLQPRHLAPRCSLGDVMPNQREVDRLRNILRPLKVQRESRSPKEHLGAVHADLADGQHQIVNQLKRQGEQINNLGAQIRQQHVAQLDSVEQWGQKLQRLSTEQRQCQYCFVDFPASDMSHCDSAADHFFCDHCFGSVLKNHDTNASMVVFCQNCKSEDPGGWKPMIYIIPSAKMSEKFFARKRELDEASALERKGEADRAKTAEEMLGEKLDECFCNKCQNPNCGKKVEWREECAKLTCSFCRMPQCAVCSWHPMYTDTGMVRATYPDRHAMGQAVHDHILAEHQDGAVPVDGVYVRNVHLTKEYIEEQNQKLFKARAMSVFSQEGNRLPFPLQTQLDLLQE